jgi:hypothetical protein
MHFVGFQKHPEKAALSCVSSQLFGPDVPWYGLVNDYACIRKKKRKSSCFPT